MSIIANDLFHQVFGSGLNVYGVPGDRLYTGGKDLAVLLALTRAIGARVVVEIGIQSGRTARTLLQQCFTITEYVGIDVPHGSTPTLRQQQREVPVSAGEEAMCFTNRLRLIVRPRGSLDLTAEDLPTACLVYIDGDHSVDAVRHDTALARRIVRTGGIVVWHDYKNEPGIGVPVVINELNRAEGNRICLVEGTWTCFEIRSEPVWPSDPD